LIPGSPREHLQQIARQRIEPVAILDHHDQRLGGGAGTKTVGEQCLQRGLAELRVEGSGEVVVLDQDVEHGRKQWRASDQASVDRREFGLDIAHLVLVG